MADFVLIGDRPRPSSRPAGKARDFAPEAERSSPIGAPYGASYESPREGALGSHRRAGSRSRRVSRLPERIAIGIAALLGVLALAAAILAFVPSAFRITRYYVSGNASMSREELLSAALLRGNERLVTLDCSRVEAALAAEPRIASAKVSKVFPNGLRIAVVERAAVATALAELDGRTVAIGIDAQGVAFAESSAASSLPVVSGLRFEGFKPGTRLPASLSRLFASLGEIQAKEPELLAAVSEIRVVKSSGGGEPELVLYPLHQAIPVRAGASLDAATLRSMILVLDVLGTRGIAPTVSEIDFRDGSVVYRGKEGHSD